MDHAFAVSGTGAGANMPTLTSSDTLWVRVECKDDTVEVYCATSEAGLDTASVCFTSDNFETDGGFIGFLLGKGYIDQLFTFLDHPDVPPDNNLAERMIRPAVILRRNCQSNRSERGAAARREHGSYGRVLADVWVTCEPKNISRISDIRHIRCRRLHSALRKGRQFRGYRRVKAP